MFRYLLCACLLLLCSTPVFSDDPPRSVANQVGVDFVGRGGQIILWSVDLKHFIKIKFLKLQEINAAGAVVAARNAFADDDFVWQRVNQVNANGTVQFVETKLISNLDIDGKGNAPNFNAQFQVDTFQFLQPFTAQFAGETITAKPGQLKWQIMVAGWKFQNNANKLRFGVHLLSDLFANNTAFTTLDRVPGTVSTTAIAFGKGNLIIPKVAVVDGKNNVTVAVNMAFEAGQIAVNWDFPAFQNTLLYDPVAATTDLVMAVSGGSSVHTFSMASLLVSMLIALWFTNQQS